MSIAQHTDPVCGMQVEAEKAAGQSEYKAQTYYFCNEGCKRRFDENPEDYVRETRNESQQ
jgi:Cu+-exporting ATPase